MSLISKVYPILTLCFWSLSTSGQVLNVPNIIIIYADDLGYGDLSCYGATDIKTPNIDRLAAHGVRFTDFYAASPSCSPSRAALLTGRYPQRMGINSVFYPESMTGMPDSEITIAEMLKTKGYTTGIVGKWHLGHLQKFLPSRQGFDYYFGIPYSNDMKSIVYMRNNDVVSYEVDQSKITMTYTKEAKQFIEDNVNNPFFLFISHSMPHVPIHASEKFLGKSSGGIYGDVIEELDWSVGEIIRKLEESGLLSNTLILFTSDNGPWLSMYEHGGSSGILRNGKQSTFEGGMRIPMIAMWDGTIEKGQVSKTIASQMDFLPTFANLVDYKIEHTVDGQDITSVLLKNKPFVDQSLLYFKGAELQGYRQGDWKIKMPFKGQTKTLYRLAIAPHDTLLFNLKNDPGEKQNLFNKRRSLALKLIEKMFNQYKNLGPLPESLVTTSKPDRSHLKYLKDRNRKTGKN